MGFRDQVKQQQAEQERLKAPAIEGDPEWEYVSDVNKGSLNMTTYVAKLNERARQGWRLHTVLEQSGNTISIFERPYSG